MSNTLKDIRETVFDRADWEPNGSTEAVSRVNRFISDVVRDVANRAPGGFHEATARVELQADARSASDLDTLKVLQASDPVPDEIAGVDSGNPWVLRAMAISAGASSGQYVEWPTDRSWDGRTLILTTPDGKQFTTRIRSVWKLNYLPPPPIGGDPITEYRISTFSPWPTDIAPAECSWEVRTETYYLPQPIVRLRSLTRFGATRYREVEVLTTDEAEVRGYTSTTDNPPSTRVQYAFQRPPARLQAPATAPSVEAQDGAVSPWKGPTVPGEFDYCVTYGFGKATSLPFNQGLARHDDVLTTIDVSDNQGILSTQPGKSRYTRMLWESAPSPISEKAVVAKSGADPVVPPGAQILTLPNIEFALGFFADNQSGSGGSKNFRNHTGRSGVYVNIYRRRLVTDFDSYDAMDPSSTFKNEDLRRLDERDDFFLLAQVRIDTLNDGRFVDDGSIIPDYSRPLDAQGIHPGFALYPRPSEDGAMNVRYIESPRALVNDTDVLSVTDSGREAIIDGALAHLMRMTGDTQGAADATSRYEDHIARLNKLNNSLIPRDHVIKRRKARSAVNRNRWRRR